MTKDSKAILKLIAERDSINYALRKIFKLYSKSPGTPIPEKWVVYENMNLGYDLETHILLPQVNRFNNIDGSNIIKDNMQAFASAAGFGTKRLTVGNFIYLLQQSYRGLSATIRNRNGDIISTPVINDGVITNIQYDIMQQYVRSFVQFEPRQTQETAVEPPPIEQVLEEVREQTQQRNVVADTVPNNLTEFQQLLQDYGRVEAERRNNFEVELMWGRGDTNHTD